MLIKFELENFRSVRDSMELSLAAINYYKEHRDELLEKTLPGLSGVRFLRAAAIFGPNASGKSTVFQGLRTMQDIVLRSASMPSSTELPYRPYLLDESSRTKPTSFFVAFVSEGVRYEYSFSYTAAIVTEEKLSAFPKGREQVWFVRKTSERQNGNLGTHINGSSFLRVPAALLPLLNDNALLLSLLANYPKYEGSIKVKPVVDWFAKGLMMLDRGPKTISDYPFSGEILDGEGTEFQRSFIQNMIRKADVGISETKVERVPFPEELRRSDLLNLLEEHEQPEEYKTVVFEHDSQFGKVKFNINDESDGTYQLFSLSGHIAQALEGGATLFVDEIDASLHPILVREVVRCFLSPGSNSNDAQLVFTAHNPCLLDEDLLRRDQVWLTEKSQGATELYPLSEYSPRNDESLVSGYLLGRYSATPLVPACFGRCDSGCEGEACGD